MAVGFSNTNKPINPRGLDASPKGYNRAALYSGKALDFDGVNDSISVADSDDLDGFTNFTYSVIAKADSTPNYCRLFDKGLDALLGAFNLSDQLYLYINSTAIQFDYVLKLNEYLHFTIVFTGGQDAKLYVNGVLEETQTHSIASVGTNSTNFAIGANNALNGNVWDGHMSNARLFNTALTAAQVSDLYNNPEKIVPTGVEDTALKLWLPMMEGAGTTAYDGSGNGNHGTISGATYVNGVGAPVAQSAVIDWNKGSNYFNYSESFSQGYWVKSYASVTEEQATAPNGLDTADKFTESSSAAGQGHYTYTGEAISAPQLVTASVYLKDNDRGFGFAQIAVDGAGKRYTIVVDLSDGSVTDTETYGGPTNTAYEVTSVGNGWYRLSVSATHSLGGLAYIVFGLSNSGTPSYTATIEPAYAGDGSTSIYAWGAQLNAGSAGPYVPTIGTTQTTPVLLPQGLTTGRDITGVNLFENVRKQGALNLDGNSWAEVHDNASLDITDEVSLETWYYHDTTTTNEGLLGRWNATTTTYLLLKNDTNVRFYTKSTSAINVNASVSTAGWHHVVGTYDGTTMRIYLDGSESATIGQTGSINTSTFPLEIGRYYSSQTYAQTGAIAQPRIYNRALTAEEVLRNYNSEKNTYQ